MNIEDLRLRHSVRVYTARPLAPEIVAKLNAAITDVNVHEAGMYFQLITESGAPFAGLSKSYGMFRNVRNYIACVVDTSYDHYLERAGFFGMQIVMKACSLGLDTCFVSGTFSSDAVEARIRVGQKLLYLITIGYGAEKQQTGISAFVSKLAHRKSLSPTDFLDTELSLDEICRVYPHFLTALKALSYAPSAMNKQPVGIRVQHADSRYNPLHPKQAQGESRYESKNNLRKKYDELMNTHSTMRRIKEVQVQEDDLVIMAYVPEKKPMQLIDLGIGMYCFSRGLPGEWEWGNPAVFLPTDSEEWY